MSTDAILAEVVRHGLQAVAEEMGAALMRTAHSVNIRDRRDFSCGVFTSSGELAAQAEHIPVHLGLLSGLVMRVREYLGGDLPAGCMLVTNDPWLTGSHLPDVVLIAPVDDGGERLGYVANMAHQVDLGGAAPGSLSLASSEIFHEGLRVGPLLLVRDNEIDERIVDLFRINSRIADTVVGDLLAQAAANTTGLKRLIELVSRIGKNHFIAATAFLRDVTARRLGECIAQIGERTASFEDVLEWKDAEGPVDLPIRARVTASRGRLTVDLSGTADQVSGPINAPRPITLSAVLYVVKTMLDPEVTSNAGLMDHIDLVTRPGSLVDARFPAAVALCTSITSQRLCDVLIGAFNLLLPGKEMAASTGSMNALIVGGTDPRSQRAFSYVETCGGGQGALSDIDGADGVHTHMTNTANSPVEAIERAYPLTVFRYGLVEGSGGAGKYRGGHGLVREIRLDADATVTVHLDRTRHRPWGVRGGGSGGLSRLVVRKDDKVELLAGKCTVALPAGTVITVETAGGGGWGDATQRPQVDIERDEREGLQSSPWKA